MAHGILEEGYALAMHLLDVSIGDDLSLLHLDTELLSIEVGQLKDEAGKGLN